MKMSFISPTKYIKEFQSQGDFILALSHLIDHDKENDYEKTDSLVDMINNHLDKQNKFRDEQKSKLTGDIQDVTFEPVD